jgi:AcrR family transcriptional regulator
MKHDNQTLLSVEQRVRAVMHAKLVEDPMARMSVSEVCRLAQVNRAGLYAHHRTLLDEIRKNHALPQVKKGAAVDRKKRAPLFNPQKVEALLYLCLELQLEVKSLKALVPDPPKARLNSRKTKGGV